MEKVSITGLDLAKNTIKVHGAAADGSVIFRRKLEWQAPGIFVRNKSMHGGDGSMAGQPLLGP